MVDALAAVTRAATWTKVARKPPFRGAHAVGALIPDNDAAGVSDTIAIGAQYASFSIEHVEVEFKAAHRAAAISRSPSPLHRAWSATSARCVPNDGGGELPRWRFRSVRHWGESAAGNWTLNVADRHLANRDLSGWTLRVYGTGTTPDVVGGGAGGLVAGPVGGPAADAGPSAREAPMKIHGTGRVGG